MSTQIAEYLFAIGQRFKFERDRLGFTQAELGLKIDATSRTIGKYETGETEARVSQLVAFMKLGADVNYILFGTRVPIGVTQNDVAYDRGDVDILLDAFARTDDVGRAALMSVVQLISSTLKSRI